MFCFLLQIVAQVSSLVPYDGVLTDNEHSEKYSAFGYMAYIHCRCVLRIPALLLNNSLQVLSLVVQCILFSDNFSEGAFSGILIVKTGYWDKLSGDGIFAFWGSRQIIIKGE